MKFIFKLFPLILTLGVYGQKADSSYTETVFAGPKLTPCPAVIAAAPTGEVFVGLDLQGSLGKKPGYGKVVRLIDTNGDGKADKSTDFVKVDNPRGISILGDKVLILHTVVSNGKYDNQQLTLFTDKNGDGVADDAGTPLVKNIGNSEFLASRGADHSTNNIRYAIDGWVYIAVGDFGCKDAQGTDGKTLTMFGGIARVKPDGSGLEEYSSGTRNVYDIAIDPFMNIFTRENTNDGVGWWVRASHFIQSGMYGYPSLYTNFPEDMLPAMGEYGAGSGVGALYLEEPGWPKDANKNVLLADWGHSMVYIHEVYPNKASFTNKVREFHKTSQVSDLDIDGSGRMYLSAWDGAGYQGNPDKGFVTRLVPKGWSYKPFPVLKEQDTDALLKFIKSESMTARVNASYELISRGEDPAPLLEIIEDNGVQLSSRVAALYTYAAIKGAEALPTLEKISLDKEMREHAIRAMGNDLSVASKASLDVLKKGLQDSNPRVQVAAAIALGRTGKSEAASALLPYAALPENLFQKKKAKGAPVKTSAKLKNREKAIPMKVKVDKLSQLVLIVNQGKENKFDHAAWLNPTIHLKNGKKIDLTEQEPLSISVDRGIYGVNQDCLGNPLKFKGKSVKGIGVHAQAEVVFDLPSGAESFSARCILTAGSVGDGKKKMGEVTFAVSEHAVKPVADKGYVAPNVLNHHSTPNAEIVLPHIAQRAIKNLPSEDVLVSALENGKHLDGVFSASKFIHSEKLVDALIKKGKSSHKKEIFSILCRLHQQEKPFDGKSWWTTRPNPDGPYFTPVDWAGTEKINSFLSDYHKSSRDKKWSLAQMKKNKAYVTGFNKRPASGNKNKVKKIGNTAIEDIVLHLTKYKGKKASGQKVIGKVGCAGCHNIEAGETIKGPDLSVLGKMSNADMAEAIIKPGATIAPSWLTVTTKDGAQHIGTLVKEDNKNLTLHNIAGLPTVIPVADVKSRDPGLNMMSLHLCDDLTLDEFGDLIAYIKSMDSSSK